MGSKESFKVADSGMCFGTDGTERGEGVVAEARWRLQGERSGHVKI